MITKTASDSGSARTSEPYTVPPGRTHEIGPFKGKLYLKNLSSTARAPYRVRDKNTGEVPAEGVLENFPPNNEKPAEVRPGFTTLVFHNDSTDASIQVREEPTP